MQFFDIQHEERLFDELALNVSEVLRKDNSSAPGNCKVLACTNQRIIFCSTLNGVFSITVVKVEDDLTVRRIGTYIPDRN